MFSRRYRTVATMTVLAAALALSGCTGGAGDNAGKFTVFSPQGAGGKLSANSFTKLVEKKFDTTISWQTTTYDAKSANEARQIALASGNYPDVFLLVPWVTQFSKDELLKYGKQGVAIPLNSLIKKYAPNIRQAFKDTPAFKKLATAPDGNIYGMPQWNDCYHCRYQAKLWINSAWLKKLGLAMPTTTEEYFTVLKAFKTQDPNGNGKADEIPLTSSTDDLLLPFFVNAFLYDPQGSAQMKSTLTLQDGKVTLQAEQDAYRQALAYMAKLYRNGLVDAGAFTQNRAAMNAKGTNAGAVLAGSATMLHPALLTGIGQKDGRDKNYDPVPPLAGPEGVRYASFNQAALGGGSFVITNKATKEEQITAIKILDYLFTPEAEIRGQFGVEGKGWVKPSSGDVALDPTLKPLYEQIPTEAGDKPRNDAWGPMTQFYSNEKLRGAAVQSTDIYAPSGYERRLFQASKLYEPRVPEKQVYPYWNVWIPSSQAAENADLTTNIENLVTGASAEFVTGTRDISSDAAWKSYVSELHSLGLHRYLEIQQKAYDRTK